MVPAARQDNQTSAMAKRARSPSPVSLGPPGSSKKALFEERETDAPCVCAIDFGTARTGIAYAFTHNPEEIKILEPGGQEPGKTHTSLLLDGNGNFKAFGFKAHEDYYECDEQGLLFEKFKMFLHDAHAGPPQAVALNGRALSLIEVITKSLRYLKDDAMAKINRSQPVPMTAHQIKWVVTVPAIWRDVAKGMMRAAAYEAGMISDAQSDKLLLCLEPEAACMACEMQQRPEGNGAADGLGGCVLKNDDKFMVLDCGGGTVDITMHQVERRQPLRVVEICQPSGGPWGSTKVDEEFERFVEKLIGEDNWRRFKPSSAWLDLMKDWEESKLAFNPADYQDVNAMRVRINLSALNADDVLGGQTLQECVNRYNQSEGGNLTLKRGTTLFMPSVQVTSFFTQIINKIVHQVKELIEETPVKYIYLVGGFAESAILQERVKCVESSGGPRVIIPMRPQLMVVKGAVIFGMQKGSAIQSRIARYTYGFETLLRYDATDPEHVRRGFKEYTKLGVTTKYVKDTDKFMPLVKQGTRIRVSEEHIERGYSPAQDNQTQVTFQLYVSTSSTATFCDDEGVKKIGQVTVDCACGQTSDISMSFGTTELLAVATNATTKVQSKAQIQYNFSSL